MQETPRHAGVLPSFALAFAKRGLKTTTGTIEPGQLLSWTSVKPNAFTAKRICEEYVRVRRSRFDDIWSAPVGISLPASWRQLVDSDHHHRVLELARKLERPEQLASMTLKEVKTIIRLPVVEVLLMLARWEAHDWDIRGYVFQYSPQLPRASKLRPTPEPVFYEEVTDAWRLSVRVALRSNWVEQLDPADLRFPSHGQTALSKWLTDELEKSQLSSDTISLCNALVFADKCTWAEELALLAPIAISFAPKGPANDQAAQRWTEIFLHRYSGESGKTLQEVGERFGITRERVRQICEYMLQGLLAGPVSMPALDKLMDASNRLTRNTALSHASIDAQLRNLLGHECGIEAAIDFSRALGREDRPIKGVVIAGAVGEIERVHLVHSNETDLAWAQKAIQFAQRDCRAVGCTNFIRLAGMISLELGVSVDADALESLFTAVPGYRSVDTQCGWFTLSSVEDSLLSTRLRKLLCVSTQPVPVDEVLAAIVTDDRLYQDLGHALTFPPLHVLTALLSGWTWLHADKHNKYRARDQLDSSVVFSELEQVAVAVIERHRGVVTRNDLFQVIVEERGWTNVSLSLLLSSSPIFWKIEHALYALRCRPLDPHAFIKARSRRAMQLAKPDIHLPPDLSKPLRFDVTQSGSTEPINKRVVYIPSVLREHVSGYFRHASGSGPEIKVTDLQVRKLSGFASSIGIMPKQTFELVIDLANRTYDVAMKNEVAN